MLLLWVVCYCEEEEGFVVWGVREILREVQGGYGVFTVVVKMNRED